MPHDNDFYDYDDSGDDFDEDEDGELPFDCHMGPDGQCGAAGSEDCDFECPVMAQIIQAEARKKQKSKKENS